MFKDYNAGLGNYIKDVLNLEVLEIKKETAFEMYVQHHDQRKVTFPFVSYYMTGDIELDTTRYNSVIHRVGIVVENNHATKRATRNRAIPITHPYSIDIWAQEKDSLAALQRTFWISVLDNPIVQVFSRETRRTYRVALNMQGSVNENINQAEEKAGYFNATISIGLGVWIRIPKETKTIAKAIMEYVESPENHILMLREYTENSFST